MPTISNFGKNPTTITDTFHEDITRVSALISIVTRYIQSGEKKYLNQRIWRKMKHILCPYIFK